MFGTSEKEGVSVDVTGEGFSTTAVMTAWMSLNYESCRYLCEGSYINRQRGNSSVDLNPNRVWIVLHCFVSFSGTDNST